MVRLTIDSQMQSILEAILLFTFSRAGYGLVAGACQNCLGGFAAPDWGISPCYTCPPGQFSTPTSATCTVW